MSCRKRARSPGAKKKNTREVFRGVPVHEIERALRHHCEGVQEEIGRGSYGIVFGVSSKVKGSVAAKVVPFSGFKAGPLVSTEADVLTLLRGHRNIIGLEATYVLPTTHLGVFLRVLELERMTMDLQDLIWKFPYHTQGNPDTRREIMWSLLSALEHSHANGIIHTDIKPGNILVRVFPSLKVKVTDWNMSREIDAPFRPGEKEELATLPYRSPEMIGGSLENCTYAVDNFAAGCVGAQLLTSRPLFAGVTDEEDLRVMQLLYLVQMPDQLRKTLSKFTEDEREVDLYMSLLRFEAETRPSAKEALAHLFFDPVREKKIALF